MIEVDQFCWLLFVFFFNQILLVTFSRKFATSLFISKIIVGKSVLKILDTHKHTTHKLLFPCFGGKLELIDGLRVYVSTIITT